MTVVVVTVVVVTDAASLPVKMEMSPITTAKETAILATLMAVAFTDATLAVLASTARLASRFARWRSRFVVPIRPEYLTKSRAASAAVPSRVAFLWDRGLAEGYDGYRFDVDGFERNGKLAANVYAQ